MPSTFEIEKHETDESLPKHYGWIMILSNTFLASSQNRLNGMLFSVFGHFFSNGYE